MSVTSSAIAATKVKSTRRRTRPSQWDVDAAAAAASRSLQHRQRQQSPKAADIHRQHDVAQRQLHKQRVLQHAHTQLQLEITRHAQQQQQLHQQQQQQQRVYLQPQAGHVALPAGGPSHALATPTPAPAHTRRLYVGSLHRELTEQHVRLAFAMFGTIVHISMPRDPATQATKGYAFVEYADAQSARDAIATMDGFELRGRALKVKPPNPPTTSASASASSSAGSGEGSSGSGAGGAGGVGLRVGAATSAATTSIVAPAATTALNPHSAATSSAAELAARLFVDGLPPHFDEDDVQPLFSPYGYVPAAQLCRHDNGTSKGYAFVTFAAADAAAVAVAALHGTPLEGGRVLRVMLSSEATVPEAASDRIAAAMHKSSSVSGTTSSVAAAPATTAAAVSSAATPQSCVVRLRNTVGAGETASELAAEVRLEVEAFGGVDRVVVDVNDVTGATVVFVKFTSLTAARQAKSALNARLIDGRIVEATFYDVAAFDSGHYSLP